MPRRLPFFVLLLSLVLALGVRTALAASPTPPDLMSYQGYLVDVNGAPLAPSTPANYPIDFRIYDASTGGNILWAEQQIVTVDKGNFSVVLGEGTAISGEARPALSAVFGGETASDRYLGIAVTISGTTMTISPRLRLLPSAYAFAATAASKLINNSGQTLLTLANGKLEGTSELTLNPGPLTVTGNATVSGNVSVGPLLVNASSSSSSSPAFKVELSGANLLAYKAGASSTTLENTGGGSLNLQTQGGNVGIGTTAPSTRLTVQSGSSSYGMIHTDGTVQVGTYVGGSTGGGWFGTKSNHKLSFFVNDGGPKLTVDTSGNVGIGTTTPQAPLEVGGSVSHTKNYRYVNFSGGPGGPATANAPYSILASRFIGCEEINVFSDARMKTVVGLSDNRQDLETIQKLRVTDYRMADTVEAGNSVKKGFIAQEVEAIIPEAVTASTRFVPDIYSLPSSFYFNEQQQTLSVTLPKPHGLKEGDRVRIVADDSQPELSVTGVPSETGFVVAKVEKAPKQIFVYGKEVPDFRTLNYDRIFTTGIGAIQELARRTEALEKSEARIAELEEKTARIAELEARASQVDALEKRVRELEGVEQQVAELRKLVAELASAARRAPEPVAALSRGESAIATANE